MAVLSVFMLLLSLVITAAYPMLAPNRNQSEFFSLMKASLSGNALSNWDISGGNSVCNFAGVSCNSQGYVEELDMTSWSISGHFPTGICSYLPELKTLRLGRNNLRRDFLYSIGNCSFLEELNLSFLYLTGKLPDLSGLKSLRILDMSYNQFTGEFPVSIFNLTNLEIVSFNENNNLNLWKLPENISRLTNIKSMILATCRLNGPIPAEIGKMTSLVDLELSGNFLSGPIPEEIGLLKNLQQLELYYNYHLSGKIPEEIGNLTELVDLDASVNKFTVIPESICRLPKLEVLQLYNNSLTGEIPRCLGKSTTLRILSLYVNNLTGEVPENFGQSSPMIGMDLSENFLSGPLPPGICKAGKLKYFLVLKNKFSGKIPLSYAECTSLIRFRVSDNHLEGPVPERIFGLPHVSIIDLSYNNFSGPISKMIGGARNLSELFLESNKFSGAVPPEISGATNLVKIHLSNNLLSGPIPSEIGCLRKLNELMLKGNRLNSSIPDSLSLLKSLNVLDLSNNLLTGKIPESLGELLQTSIDLSNNLLSGPIPDALVQGGLVESFSGNPGLCITGYINEKFPICPQNHNRKKLNSIWAITILVFIIVLGALLLLRRQLSKERAIMEHDEMMSELFFSFNIKSFHRLSFDPRQILESMIDKNMVGQGGSGRVYKVELGSGEVVAVKRLWSKKSKESASSDDQLVLDKELKTEVETLGSIRHKNIVKLYSYFSNLDCRLLVYEYMPNGNLWEALHKGWVHLSWPIRHQIALGVAQGLAYLHHDLMPPMIHRDIKSTNILLDANYQPKVADFGIAKVLQARGKDSTTTVIAGTYGYLAPEYAYTSKATTKCDVYSFGVVLMELITGKKPVEPEFGDNKNIIYWVSTKMDTKDGLMEVLDRRLSDTFRDHMIQVLQIAIRCTCKSPTLRPTMNEVVQLLIQAVPCVFASGKLLDKTKEASNVTKIKNQSEI